MKKQIIWIILALLTLFAIVSYAQRGSGKASASDLKQFSVATFAGGCFWCTEADFEKLPGVHEVISGYSGGDVPNPSYKQVSMGTTDHVESVQVYYDPNTLSYETLLAAFWRQINPTDNDGQFVDRGPQYRSLIFYNDETERQIAERSRQELDASKRYDQPIITEIRKFGKFYPAEDYHQNYYSRNPIRYNYYRSNSGRDQYLTKIWGKDLKLVINAQGNYGKPSDQDLRSRLSQLQYDVTQNDATEAPFKNTYWNEKRQGIYVDVVSGEPLFSSKDKFKSGTGWPSFTRPLVKNHVVEKTDFKLIYPRTEIRSRYGDSHLGHLFKDGPEPTGLRYCINSAALRFVPAEKLISEGYQQLVAEFESTESD